MYKKSILALAVLITTQVTLAQTESTTTSSKVATEKAAIPHIDLLLNGIVLDKDMYESRLQIALQNGQVDSTELRLAIREELYNKALLIEEAKRSGYTKNKAIKLLAQEAQENVYIDFVMQDYFKSHPITQELLQAEYEHQIQLIGPKRIITEFHLATIVVPDEEQAKDLIKKSKKEKFAELAKANSQDASASRGGDLGWINSYQIDPSLQKIIANTPKGSIISSPIQIGNSWHVIRVTNRRDSKLASFQRSQNRLKQIVAEQIKNNYIQELRQTRLKEKASQ